jgi:pantoate--beta-alanine ligase
VSRPPLPPPNPPEPQLPSLPEPQLPSLPESQPPSPPERGPALLRTKPDLAAARLGLPAPVVLVPTMGALHAGHRALLRSARAAAGPSGSVIVSIFVNPLQFRPGEDLDRYPRTLDDDLAMCAQEGVRAVFAPSAAEMYPGGPPRVTVDPGPAGQMFEGEFRPGFFGGVLTVVLKLFHLVRPDVAVFGEKDAQQLALVRRLVADTDLGLAIEPVPIVRDPDGLATSSRNRYLSVADRELALTLPRALRAGQARAAAEYAGTARAAVPISDEDAAGSAHSAAAALAAAQEVLRGEPALAVDYVAVVDPRTFGPAGPGPALIVAAVTAGGTRLIDNVPVVLAAGQNTERDFLDAADH